MRRQNDPIQDKFLKTRIPGSCQMKGRKTEAAWTSFHPILSIRILPKTPNILGLHRISPQIYIRRLEAQRKVTWSRTSWLHGLQPSNPSTMGGPICHIADPQQRARPCFSTMDSGPGQPLSNHPQLPFSFSPGGPYPLDPPQLSRAPAPCWTRP